MIGLITRATGVKLLKTEEAIFSNVMFLDNHAYIVLQRKDARNLGDIEYLLFAATPKDILHWSNLSKEESIRWLEKRRKMWKETWASRREANHAKEERHGSD